MRARIRTLPPVCLGLVLLFVQPTPAGSIGLGAPCGGRCLELGFRIEFRVSAPAIVGWVHIVTQAIRKTGPAAQSGVRPPASPPPERSVTPWLKTLRNPWRRVCECFKTARAVARALSDRPDSDHRNRPVLTQTIPAR